MVIGDGERPWWDAILIVQYPTPQAFIEMVTSAENIVKVHEHRAAALERGDLIATSTGRSHGTDLVYYGDAICSGTDRRCQSPSPSSASSR